MQKPLLVVVLLALALPAPLVGGEPGDLTLQQAITRAVTRNPDILASIAAEDASNSRVDVARSAFLPRLNYRESFARSNNQVFVFGTLLTQERFTEDNFSIDKLNHPDPVSNFQSRFGLQQLVFDGGRNVLALRDARIGHEMAGEQRRQAEMGTIFEIVRTYFGVLVAGESLEVIGNTIEATRADLSRAEALMEAGMATQADVLSLRVHHAGLEAEQIRAANEVRILEARLNRLMSDSLDTERQLTTPLEPMKELEPPQLETLMSRALARRPELRQTSLGLELAANARKRARSAFLPEVAFEAGWESDRESFLGSGGSNWMVGVALELNLFNGLADKARLGEAAAGERMSDAHRAGAEDAVRLDVRSAFLDLEAVRQRVEVTREAVEQARESHHIIESRYEAGLTNVTELLRSQNAVLDAEARSLGALYEQRVATVRLEMATGTLNPESGALKP